MICNTRGAIGSPKRCSFLGALHCRVIVFSCVDVVAVRVVLTTPSLPWSLKSGFGVLLSDQ